MLLTRSIRRKLVTGIALVVVLVAILTLSSIRGLRSYRNIVDDLQLSIGDLPRSAELIRAFSPLFDPLNEEIPPYLDPQIREQRAQRNAQEFADAFVATRARINRFKDAWQNRPDRLRHRYSEQVPITLLFRTVNDELLNIEFGIPKLGQPDSRDAIVVAMRNSICRLNRTANELPDPAHGLKDLLQEAKNEYRIHLRMVTGLGFVSVIGLLLLMLWGYQLIVAPIRKLHQGVRRITEGNYAYRLKIETKCEISALADAFNQMAMRIQEDSARMSQEIEQRSKQLVLSERLAGAGFLAAGVAHEINNPLAVIMTAAYGLDARLDDGVLASMEKQDRDDVHEYLGLIQSEAERCERITKKLLDFSHGKDQERNLYDVTAIIEEVVNMLGHLSRYQDRKVLIDRSAPLRAWINAPEIKQVVLNLIANALDASGQGGQVDVSLSESPDNIEISVKDNGCGMTPEQMSRIFEPFYTTKDVGKGTGLGLSISHRIAVDHGGTLEVSSPGPGEGAKFSLRLPKRASVAKAA